MYFKKIEIHGFKSFAEYVNVEFHDGITCIVGPNGSGKSNISDAIKWVLGEQSPKSLRGGEMKDVIFAGTEKRKPRGMAEVTLTIDNTRSILPIDYTEVAVTRRMYRSGESEYQINNNACRLRDIKELFMDTGIGVDGYSIIGQGKISEIVNSKPEGRREIFEEAAGIVKYRTKKVEAERKLNSTNQNLLRVYDIVKELEERIEPLREESVIAKEYIELKSRFKTIEINLTLKNIENYEERLNSYTEEIRVLEEQTKKFVEEKENIDANYHDNKMKNEELTRVSSEIQEKLLKMIDDINQVENDMRVNQERALSIDKDELRITSEIEQISQKKSREDDEKAQLAEREKVVEAQFAQMQKLQNEADEVIEKQNAKLEEARVSTEKLKSELIDEQNNIFGKRSEIQNIKSIKDTLLRRKSKIESESETQQSENSLISEDYEQNKDKRQRLKDKIDLANEELKTSKVKYNERVAQEKAKNEELNRVNTKLNEAVTRQKLLIDLDNSYDGYNNAVKYLMKNDHIKAGIHGVVADVVDVPSGFEVAIETALGAALQNIICQDDYSAKRAIDLLKRNKAGRVTFLPVESIKSYGKPLDASKISRERGYKGLAVDIISFNDTYSEIMKYLLGRVVIADNIDNAVILSKKVGNGMRVVTLDGEVINASGAISGGSYRTNNNNILSRKAETRKLSDQIIEFDQEYNEMKQELDAMNRTIKNTGDRITVLDNDIRRKNSDLMTIEQDLSRIEHSMNMIKVSEDKMKNEISEIQSEEQNADSMINKLEREVKQYIYEVKSLESRVKESMAYYALATKEKEQVMNDITNLKMNVLSSENELSNVKEQMQRANRLIEGYNHELGAKNKDLSSLQLEKSQLDILNTGLLDKSTELKDEKDQVELSQKQYAEEKEKLVQYIEEKTERKEAIDAEINGLLSKKHELELKYTKSETQIDALKDKLWDEFEISYIQAIEMRKTEFKVSTASKEARTIRERLREIGDVNVGAIQEYESVKERYDFLITQRDDLLEAIESLEKVINDMDKIIRTNFTETFTTVAGYFSEIFSEMFGGGRAELKMNEGDDILSTGIDIIAQPPGKNLKNINLMSGGEKTLTAVALTFAILKYKPTPFCILDEIEAALDDVNINRFVSYLKNFEDIQFVLVTHQKATMEFADVLYGVTMAEQGISKILSLKLEEKAG